MRSLKEKFFFSFPKLYDLKISFLKKINKMHALSIDHLVADKNIIDIGCGSRSLFYEPEKTASRTGIDSSPEMIESAKKIYPTSKHYVAFAEKLPFEDKSFDIALIQFVLHHVEPENWEKVLKEAKRVAKKHIIIFDHVKHDKFIPGFIQQSWWNLTDGGKIYRKELDWKNILSNHNLNILNYKRVGSLFGNICFYHLKV